MIYGSSLFDDDFFSPHRHLMLNHRHFLPTRYLLDEMLSPLDSAHIITTKRKSAEHNQQSSSKDQPQHTADNAMISNGSDTTAAAAQPSQSNETAIQKQRRALFRQPVFDICESEKAVTIRAETPGLAKEDLKVNVQSGRLTISGEHSSSSSQEEEEGKFQYRRFASFKHTWTIPAELESEGLSASYADGVLNVTIPKKSEEKSQEAREVQIL